MKNEKHDISFFRDNLRKQFYTKDTAGLIKSRIRDLEGDLYASDIALTQERLNLLFHKVEPNGFIHPWIDRLIEKGSIPLDFCPNCGSEDIVTQSNEYWCDCCGKKHKFLNSKLTLDTDGWVCLHWK